MCKVFNVGRSGYYHWELRKPSKRTEENKELKHQIEQVYQKSKKRYGSPKITMELKDMGYNVSRPRVARLMQQEGIKSIIRKKYRCQTTISDHKLEVAENLLDRHFKAQSPGEKWVSDITYIPTLHGWLYLTIILDLFDRKIVGWSLSTNMTTRDTTLAAWKMAIKNRAVLKGMLFHSDRGVQYASHEFRDGLQQENVIQSMSRKGDCWDNAVAENFFKILKSELVQHEHFYSILDAKNAVFEFIEIWYNRKRKHSYLGYRTPEEFGNNNGSVAKTA